MKTVNKIVHFSIAFVICCMVYFIVTIMTCFLIPYDWERAKREFKEFDFIGDMKEFIKDVKNY